MICQVLLVGERSFTRTFEKKDPDLSEGLRVDLDTSDERLFPTIPSVFRSTRTGWVNQVHPVHGSYSAKELIGK